MGERDCCDCTVRKLSRDEREDRGLWKRGKRRG